MPAVNTDEGVILEALNDKLDRDMENLDTATQGPDVVIDWQLPTAANSYTWYRKYKSGWVEQGARYTVTTASPHTMTLPVTMANTYYSIMLTVGIDNAGDATVQINVRTDMITTASFAIQKQWTSSSGFYYWQVSGMAA